MNRLKKLKLWKKIVLAAVLLLAGTIVFYWNWTVYGLKQLTGQLSIITNTVPLEEALENDQLSKIERDKLRWIIEIKQFAEDSIGLTKTDNYQTFYDASGSPLLWNVSACPPYSLNSYKWNYPFLGKLAYKGFFDQKAAQKEAGRLKQEGYDTDINEVTAWSTLGILSDPVLSTMLRRDSARLAELIIHELTHATFYIPGEGDLNENAAVFIGREGAKRLLRAKGFSGLLADYEAGLSDKDKIRLHLKFGAKELKQLYDSFSSDMPEEKKQQLKREKIREIMISVDTLELYSPKNYGSDFIKSLNNTFFTSYLMYQSGQDSLQTEFENRFNNRLPDMVEYYKGL